MKFQIVPIGTIQNWTLQPRAKLGWFINIRSAQSEDPEDIWGGSLINWWRPWQEVKDSRRVNEIFVISANYQFMALGSKINHEERRN